MNWYAFLVSCTL